MKNIVIKNVLAFCVAACFLVFVHIETVHAEVNFNDGTYFIQYAQDYVDLIRFSLHPQYIVNQALQYELTSSDIQAIRKILPDTKILRYRSGIEIFDATIYDDTTWWDEFHKTENTEAEWNRIWASHKDWFLKNPATGAYLTRPGELNAPGNTAFNNRVFTIDIGNLEYQQWLFSWIHNKIKSYGFDGIYLDLLYPAWQGRNFRGKDSNISTSDWNKKIAGLVQYIQSHKKDIPSLANTIIVINGVGYTGQDFITQGGKTFIAYTQTDGVQYEGFLSDLYLQHDLDKTTWKEHVAIVSALSSLQNNTMRGWVNAKFVRGATRPNDTHTASFHKKNSVFALTSFLLGNNSPNFAFTYFGSAEQGLWVGAKMMDFGFTLGSAIEPMQEYATRLYSRTFTNGIIFVNPTGEPLSFIFQGDNKTDWITKRIYKKGDVINLPEKNGLILININAHTLATPTPTPNAACVCSAAGKCTTACFFDKFATSATSPYAYSSPIKCSLGADLFMSIPTQADKDKWCRNYYRTKGDANGDGKANLMDYFYFLSARSGQKLPPSVNVDFDGNGYVTEGRDRAVIIQSLIP